MQVLCLPCDGFEQGSLSTLDRETCMVTLIPGTISSPQDSENPSDGAEIDGPSSNLDLDPGSTA